MANRQSGAGSPRQGDRGIPEMEDSPKTGDGEDRIRGGSDEEISDIADDESDELEETVDVDDEEEEDEGSI